VFSAYFDESGTDKQSPIMCVAGYVFADEEVLRFTAEWNELLAEYGLPYLHMKDFVHSRGPFKGLARADRDGLYPRLIAVLRARLAHGIVISMSEREYEAVVPRELRREFESAYAVCSFLSFVAVQRWADRERYDGPIAYTFEAGDEHASEAARHMQGLAQDPIARAVTRYDSHSFASRESAVPLQAADVLAWEWTKHVRDTVMRRARPTRKSLHELARDRPGSHTVYHLQGPRVLRWAEKIQSPKATAGSRAWTAGVGVTGGGENSVIRY
jgi:hypothetical protein